MQVAAGASQIQSAPRLLIAADVNAVPPAGIEGVGVMDDGKSIGNGRTLGIGALAIGNVKYQVQRRLFEQMLAAKKPLYLGFRGGARRGTRGARRASRTSGCVNRRSGLAGRALRRRWCANILEYMIEGIP